MAKKSKDDTIRKAFKYRIYPNKAQRSSMRHTFNCCRFVWNHFLDIRIRSYERKKGVAALVEAIEAGIVTVGELDSLVVRECEHFENIKNQRADHMKDDLGLLEDYKRTVYLAFWRWFEERGFESGDPKVPSAFDMSRMVKVLKNERVDEDGHRWLYDADATALIYVTRHLDQAYARFFDNFKKGRVVSDGDNPYGYPQFKKRRRGGSYTTKGKGIKVDYVGNRISIPKFGWVKATLHQHHCGRIVSATISEDSCGDFYISLGCDGVMRPEALGEGEGEIAVEVGVEHLAVLSNGEVFDKPVNYKQHDKRLKIGQQRLSRKVGAKEGEPKSNGWIAQNHRVNKVNRRISRARNYRIHEVTTEIVKRFDVIYIRDVKVSELLKKDDPEKRKGLRKVEKKRARNLADSALYEFRRQIMYKADWYGKLVVLIPSDYPSTQRCSSCGYVNKALAGEEGLAIREWDCPECGVHHKRDFNSALNLLEEGRRIMET